VALALLTAAAVGGEGDQEANITPAGGALKELHAGIIQVVTVLRVAEQH